MRALRLTHVSFDRVEFTLVPDDGSSRLVVVRVGSGSTWLRSVSFPGISGEGGETTGDDALDAAIRERAAEELVRLEAAVRAARDASVAAC